MLKAQQECQEQRKSGIYTEEPDKESRMMSNEPLLVGTKRTAVL